MAQAPRHRRRDGVRTGLLWTFGVATFVGICVFMPAIPMLAAGAALTAAGIAGVVLLSIGIIGLCASLMPWAGTGTTYARTGSDMVVVDRGVDPLVPVAAAGAGLAGLGLLWAAAGSRHRHCHNHRGPGQVAVERGSWGGGRPHAPSQAPTSWRGGHGGASRPAAPSVSSHGMFASAGAHPPSHARQGGGPTVRIG